VRLFSKAKAAQQCADRVNQDDGNYGGFTTVPVPLSRLSPENQALVLQHGNIVNEAVVRGGAQQLYAAKLVSSHYHSNPYYGGGTCYASLSATGHSDYARLDLPLRRGARVKLFSSVGAAEDFLQTERAEDAFSIDAPIIFEIVSLASLPPAEQTVALAHAVIE
jgi:hypothetical protein